MPTAVKDGEIPTQLWSMVHDLLVSSGFDKAAKALSKKVNVEPLSDDQENLLAIFNKFNANGSTDKKRKRPAEVEEIVPKVEKSEKEGKKKKKAAKKEESEDEEEEEAPPPKKEASKKKKESVDDSDSSDTKGTPSSKTAANGHNTPEPDSSSKQSSAQKRNSNASPFQRVKAEEVTYLKVKGGKAEEDRLKDNTFESKGGDVFGAKASEILVAVRGKDFRHEKTKKKRSFRSSGPIDMNSNSIKFDSEEED